MGFPEKLSGRKVTPPSDPADRWGDVPQGDAELIDEISTTGNRSPVRGLDEAEARGEGVGAAGAPDLAADLDRRVTEACGIADRKARYYEERIGGSRLGSQISHFLAVVLGGFGALLSLAASSTLHWDPALAPAALIVAGIAVSLDHFLGWTNQWTRFTTKTLILKQARGNFVWSYKIAKKSWANGEPTNQQYSDQLDKIQAFKDKIDTIVIDETNAWMAEQQQTLKDLQDVANGWQTSADSAISQLTQAGQTLAAASAKGAVNLELQNACDSPWNYWLDQGNQPPGYGTTVTIPNVAPGIHQITVEGRYKGNDLWWNQSFPVQAGLVYSAQVTLAPKQSSSEAGSVAS